MPMVMGPNETVERSKFATLSIIRQNIPLIWTSCEPVREFRVG